MPSPVEETYLESIYNLAMEEGHVRAVDLASRFGVSRPTVAQTLKKLSESGYITQDRVSGLRLTPHGQTETEGLLRRHRLAERLMFDVLGMDFISAHEQAHSLEHWLSPEVEERIQSLLGAPQTCPHGNPIPGNAPGGLDYLRSQNARRLSTVNPGDSVAVVCISEVVEDETALLRQLLDTGIVPGRQLNVTRRHDNGVVEYVTVGSDYAIAGEIAEKIWVRPLSTE
jgi:DtxR family Mn-dependent transcriptional regulator